jgi:hypothetical protein
MVHRPYRVCTSGTSSCTGNSPVVGSFRVDWQAKTFSQLSYIGTVEFLEVCGLLHCLINVLDYA